MRPCGAGIVSPLMVLALGLTGCGAQAPSSHPSASATAAATSTPSPCPDSPRGETLPSPLPTLGDSLSLPTSPCGARYEGVADVRGLTTFTLTIGRLRPGVPYFAPTVLKGTAGESLHLQVVNTTSALHNISIPDERIDVDVPAGGTVDVVVTFPTGGPIVYFCSYHADEDQAGELFTVSP
jgi:hypothetical protein